MAWAERLPSGRYRGVYRDSNDRRRSAGTFAHKARAEREAAAKEAQARRASWRDLDAGKRTWGDWCDSWWPTRSVEPGTLDRDASRRRVHLDPRWAAVPINSINRHDVAEWASSMMRAGVGPSTVQRAVHLLSASLAAAVDAEVIEANPAARLKLVKAAQEQERFLSHDEYDAVCGEMPSTDDQLVMHLLGYTGLRWGEMAGLHWHRVDMARAVVNVVETWDERVGRIKGYPKGRMSRAVPVPAWLRDLVMVRDRGSSCGLTHTAGRCRSGLVVTTESGTVMRNSNWSDVWRDAVERSKIGHARIHDLRHTYASWLLQAGVPLAEVGRLMGHRSAATTQKYAHLAAMPNEAVLAALGGDPVPRLPHGPDLEQAL